MVSLVLWLRGSAGSAGSAPPLMETHSVIDSNKSDEYNRKYIVTDEIDLKNGKELISFFKDSGQFDNHKLYQKNSSISIALAVTAYARIHMSQFKNNKDIRLFYTDTDSIISDKPLPDYFVDSTELGKMKLEHVVEKGIFLAPKLYCLKTNNKIITKTRGLSHNIQLNIEDFENLLFKDSEIIKKQNK